MNFRKLFGLEKKVADTDVYPYDGMLHLCEDDYLMLELLPKENLDFIKSETARINDFGQQHFNGHGFTEITSIGEKPFNTAEKLIDISELVEIISNFGLHKVVQFHMQGVGLLQGESAPFGFGSNTFAIMCEQRNNLLTDIWITGRTVGDEEKNKLIEVLFQLGQTFDFIAVNWYSGEYYNMAERSSVEQFATAV
jgi:hypothetical protein